MKYSKRYIVFGVLVAAMLIFKLEPGASGSGTVENFRGANLQATTWNPLIASSVNDNLLSLVIDNKEYTNENHTFYMDDQLNIMVPVNILRDALNCSAHVYDGKRLLVEKHANEVEFSLGASEAKVNGTREVIVSPFIRKDDTYYVSLNDLANYLDYSYSWDIQENQASAMDTSDSATIIPTRYDLREKGRAAAVRNQGTFGTCWAFAALGALESSLLPEEKLQFSVDHMTMNNGFTLTQDDGGEYTMGMAYLAAWKDLYTKRMTLTGTIKRIRILQRSSMCRKCRSSTEKIMRRSRSRSFYTAECRRRSITGCAARSQSLRITIRRQIPTATSVQRSRITTL